MSDFTRQPLLKKLNRQNILSRMEAMERQSVAAPSARVRALSEFSNDLGSVGQGIQQLIVTANQVMARNLNYYMTYSTTETQMTPDIHIQQGGISSNTIFTITLVGKYYNNTGGAVNLTPKVYLGLSGSETQVASGTVASLTASSAERGWRYILSVSGSPVGSKYVQVDEKIEYDNSLGDVIGFVRSTNTLVGTITSLSEIDNLYITFTFGTASAAIRLWSNKLKVELISSEADAETEHRFFSTTFEDSFIQSNTATTNYGSNSSIFIGESNAAVSVNRSLLRCTNITEIPAGASVKAVILRLYISGDAASNPGGFYVYNVRKNWTEAGVTWNTYDGSNNWAVSGLDLINDGVDIDTTPIGAEAFTASEPIGKVFEFNLSPSYIQNILEGGTNYGIMIKTSLESNDMYQFASSENTTTYANPELEVVYTL